MVRVHRECLLCDLSHRGVGEYGWHWSVWLCMNFMCMKLSGLLNDEEILKPVEQLSSAPPGEHGSDPAVAPAGWRTCCQGLAPHLP